MVNNEEDNGGVFVRYGIEGNQCANDGTLICTVLAVI